MSKRSDSTGAARMAGIGLLAPLGVVLLGLSLAGPALALPPTQAWVAQYNAVTDGYSRASQMVVDGTGSVYVTGRSRGEEDNIDYATVKYDSDGNELWVARYDGPAGGADLAYSIGLDALGNVYVTGESDGIGTDRDMATVKYDPDGNELWVARYVGPAGIDAALALAVSGAGDVYVTGPSIGAGTSEDYVTIRYDTDGNELWVARYDGPASGNDGSRAIGLDAAGHANVTGTSEGIGTDFDAATIQYDADGNELWVARYVAASFDAGEALAMDSAGHVYVAGQSSSDYLTIEYDPDGNQLWAALYGVEPGIWDHAEDVAVDGDGNVCVTGYGRAGWTAATVKYDTDGNQLWAALYDSSLTTYDAGTALTLDGAGNVYVAGYRRESGPAGDYASTLIQYSPGGTRNWVVLYDSLLGHDFGQDVAVDGSGNIYVTGFSEPFLSEDVAEYFTVKYVPTSDWGTASTVGSEGGGAGHAGASQALNAFLFLLLLPAAAYALWRVNRSRGTPC